MSIRPLSELTDYELRVGEHHARIYTSSGDFKIQFLFRVTCACGWTSGLMKGKAMGASVMWAEHVRETET